jgi:uncharacterized DUF497 family protein
MRFDWDPEKETANLEKHGVSFGEVTTLFTSGEHTLEIYDEQHSEDEDRLIAIGPVQGRIVVVVFTEWPEETVRLISARLATVREIELYRACLGDPNDGP